MFEPYCIIWHLPDSLSAAAMYTTNDPLPDRTARNAWPRPTSSCTSSWHCRPSTPYLWTGRSILDYRVHNRSCVQWPFAANDQWHTRTSGTRPWDRSLRDGYDRRPHRGSCSSSWDRRAVWQQPAGNRCHHRGSAGRCSQQWPLCGRRWWAAPWGGGRGGNTCTWPNG